MYMCRHVYMCTYLGFMLSVLFPAKNIGEIQLKKAKKDMKESKLVCNLDYCREDTREMYFKK